MRKHSLKFFSLASLGIKILFAHIILQSPKVTPISHPSCNYKRVTKETGGGILTELNVKEIVKNPEEVTEKHCRFFLMQRSWNPSEV